MIFDANQYLDAALDGPDRSVIKQGEYVATILEATMKPTKKKNGHYLNLKLEIVDGQYKGKWLWTMLNLDNPNESTVKIAKEQLSLICATLNKTTIDNFSLTDDSWCGFMIDGVVKIYVSEKDGAKDYPGVTSFVYKKGSAVPSKQAAPAKAEEKKFNDSIPF